MDKEHLKAYHLTFHTTDVKLVGIPSEAIEPFAQYMIGRLFDRCEKARKVRDSLKAKTDKEMNGLTFNEAMDYEKFSSLCADLWYGVQHLSGLGTVARTCTHFTIAMGNHMSLIARYIEEHLGINPFKEWK